MVNIISSAITNAPPPNAVANMLNKRNKLHHFNSETDENLMELFYQNPNGTLNRVNHTTLPVRNYCIITENAGLSTLNEPAAGEAVAGAEADGGLAETQVRYEKTHSRSRSKAEARAATDAESGDMIPARHQTGSIDHPSAQTPGSGTKRRYALDVSIRAEIDPKSDEGRTLGYGFCIPCLEL